MTPEERIRWIYAAKDPEELARRYDAWAQEYDQHLEVDLNYIAPAIGVERLARRVPTGARILDAGAGTGLVGQRLHEVGYRDIVALDYAAGMLEKARAKGVYTELSQQSLADPLTFDTSSFDAVISIGVFTYGHAPATAFDELIRITRAGGIILFSVLTEFYKNSGFRDHLDQLEKAGKWTLLDAGEPFPSRNNIDSDASGQSFTYEVR
ncbi:MAG: class I SAM-dependent methyltransferase [Myxococcota bacterium]